MRRVGLIISYNKRINENLRNGNTELAARWYTRLRLLEIFSFVPEGAYRLPTIEKRAAWTSGSVLRTLNALQI